MRHGEVLLLAAEVTLSAATAASVAAFSTSAPATSGHGEETSLVPVLLAVVNPMDIELICIWVDL